MLFRTTFLVLFYLLPCNAYQTPVSLQTVDVQTAGEYAILSKAGVTNTGATSVTGDIGTSPIAATALTGFALTKDVSEPFSTSIYVTGKVYAADYAAPTPATLGAAVLDMGSAYTDAAGRANPDFLNLDNGGLNGITLQPGLYRWVSTVTVSGDITFHGTATDIWILQITSNFNTASSAVISLTGGAKPENIFWQIAGATTFGTNSHVEGIFLAATHMVFQTGSTLMGCAYAQTAITLDTATISCGLGPSDEPSLVPSKRPTLLPSLSVSPSMFPSSDPSFSGSPSFSPSGSPSSSVYPSVRPSGAPSVEESVGPSVSIGPSGLPSLSVSPSNIPSFVPSMSVVPSLSPSLLPSGSVSPSGRPSVLPSLSVSPSNIQSSVPSFSGSPSSSPSESPSSSVYPSVRPSGAPSVEESTGPSVSVGPSGLPSLSVSPSNIPMSPTCTKCEIPADKAQQCNTVVDDEGNGLTFMYNCFDEFGCPYWYYTCQSFYAHCCGWF